MLADGLSAHASRVTPSRANGPANDTPAKPAKSRATEATSRTSAQVTKLRKVTRTLLIRWFRVRSPGAPPLTREFPLLQVRLADRVAVGLQLVHASGHSARPIRSAASVMSSGRTCAYLDVMLICE
jgi:hypothetical protein